MVVVDHQLNELEVLVVGDHLENTLGVRYYTLSQGNDCIWASYGRINSYYFFRDGRLVDIQYD